MINCIFVATQEPSTRPTIMRPWECSPKKPSRSPYIPQPIHQRSLAVKIADQHSHLVKQLYHLRHCNHIDMKTLTTNYLQQVQDIELRRSSTLLVSRCWEQSDCINNYYDQYRHNLIQSIVQYLHICNTDTNDCSAGATYSGNSSDESPVPRLGLPQATSTPEDKSSRYTPYKRCGRRTLPTSATDILECWYYENVGHPYPCEKQVEFLAEQGQVSVIQVRKWMANKRVRSFNTLAFNGSVHPKRLQRIQRERQLVAKHTQQLLS